MKLNWHKFYDTTVNVQSAYVEWKENLREANRNKNEDNIENFRTYNPYGSHGIAFKLYN